MVFVTSNLNSFPQRILVSKLVYFSIIFSTQTVHQAYASDNKVSNSDKKRIERIFKNSKKDISPAPNYRGAYISLGAQNWRTPIGVNVLGASSTAKISTAPAANCSTKAIVYYAEQAPAKFQLEKNGLLYGVRTHTPATRVDNIPGYNSCALVVYAILKKAGCKWARRTANAKTIYDMAYKRGWRPASVQRAGCIVAWNAKTPGWRARIGKGIHRKKGQSKGVAYRHVGITIGQWMSMDNTSIFSRPSSFITTRPIRYEPPLFLCPPLRS